MFKSRSLKIKFEFYAVILYVYNWVIFYPLLSLLGVNTAEFIAVSEFS